MNKHNFRGLYDVYPEPLSNGYGRGPAKKRFEILKGHMFKSVLDVGSGPCYLQEWLEENSLDATYEAVDIRPETLKLCSCPAYETIPTTGSYDLVCLFGTVTYNIDGDELKNKQILKKLLEQSLKVCRSLLVFTVFKESAKQELRAFQQDRFVYFSEIELRNLLLSLGVSNFAVTEDDKLDRNEYFVTCRV